MTDRKRAAERWGRWAEWLCRIHLTLTGWRVVNHRLKSPRGTGIGELDLVARRGDVVAIIEVKARSTQAAAFESLSLDQRQRIARAAEQLLARHPEWHSCTLRFDVMAVAPWTWPKHLADAWRP